MQLTWCGTNQKCCGYQVQSHSPLFGGTFILNFDDTVDWLGSNKKYQDFWNSASIYFLTGDRN